MQSSDVFAYAIGYPRSPVDDLLVFHIVFGKTVPDISLNAVANLGYADCRFLRAVYPGDTLTAASRGDRPEGEFQPQDRRRLCALDRLQAGRREGARICALGDGAQARRGGAPRRAITCRELPTALDPRDARRRLPARSTLRSYDFALAGSPHRFGDYQVGEKIDHVDGMTVEEAEHQIATRLYQNTARVHFNQFTESKGRFGRRLIYGGHVISLARALSFNGLANAFHIAAINGGRHVAPLFAGRHGVRVVGGAGQGRACRTRPTSARCACAPSPPRTGPARIFRSRTATADDPAVILDLDYWVLMPR